MRADVVTEHNGVVIRRMRDDEDDYNRIIEWRNLPHVRRWWDPDHPPLTLERAREEYRPNTLPNSISTACIIELQGRAIGFIQFYKWSSYPEDAHKVGISFDDLTYSLDIFIGDPSQVGRGVGTAVVRLLSDNLIDELNASSVSLTTDLYNYGAQRCYEKAGFRKIKEVLDTDTWQGERVRSWLMVKEPE